MSAPNLKELPGFPGNEEGPVFSEPWEAQAFALTVAMHEKGLFEWADWAQTLGAVIAADKSGRSYYELWLEALETLITENSVLGTEEVSARKTAWREAVQRTPHGQPIVLAGSSGQQ